MTGRRPAMWLAERADHASERVFDLAVGQPVPAVAPAREHPSLRWSASAAARAALCARAADAPGGHRRATSSIPISSVRTDSWRGRTPTGSSVSIRSHTPAAVDDPLDPLQLVRSRSCGASEQRDQLVLEALGELRGEVPEPLAAGDPGRLHERAEPDPSGALAQARSSAAARPASGAARLSADSAAAQRRR